MKVTTDTCLFGAFVSKSPSIQNIYKAQHRGLRVLDIGTGTGLLSLMFAQENHDAQIEAIEINREASEEARQNVKDSPWPDRIRIINSDVRAFHANNRYDLIISNPPFYEKELKSPDPNRNLALHGSDLGLEENLTVISSSLDPGGRFFLLLPYKRKKEIFDLFKKSNLEINSLTYIRQSTNHGFFRIILEGGIGDDQKNKPIVNEIAIWNEMKEYSPDFISLLKDFYLYLG